MSTDIFRKEALAKYLRADAPGALVTIAPPRTIAVFATMALLFALLATLSIVGRVEVAAEGRGVVRPDEPAVVLRAPFDGTVLSTQHAAKDSGRAGDLLLSMDARSDSVAHDKCTADLAVAEGELSVLDKRLADWNGGAGAGREQDAAMALVLLAQLRAEREKAADISQRCDALGAVVDRSRVVFPVDAVVAEVAVGAGSQVHQGDVVATLVPSDAHLVGYVALGEQYRAEVAVGQSARVEFDALPSDELGAGSAQVTRVLDALPPGVTIEGSAKGASVFLELSLDAMPPRAGPPRTGMTFTAEVLTQRQRVLSLLFGAPSE